MPHEDDHCGAFVYIPFPLKESPSRVFVVASAVFTSIDDLLNPNNYMLSSWPEILRQSVGKYHNQLVRLSSVVYQS